LKPYLLDANVFIQAKRFHYPFDVFPGFWKWLESEMRNGSLRSIKPIFNELKAGNDVLAEWAEDQKEWFLPVEDEQTQREYARIVAWVSDKNQGYTQPAINEYLDVGDSWLVAMASTENMTIVTHEKFNAQRKSKILIPNVCRTFGIEYIDTIELIRRTGARFHLQS